MTHTAKAWAREFVEVLETIPVAGAEAFNGSASSSSLASLGSPSEVTNNQMKAALPAPLDVDGLLAAFAQSKYRLIITGLAGIVSRATALKGGSNGGASTSNSSSSSTHIRSDYEENAGELWGWEESSPSHSTAAAPTSAAPTAASASSASASASQAAAASPAYIRGPSRYGSHSRRMSTFAALPSSSKQAEQAMEEWMDMDHADADGEGAEHSGEGGAATLGHGHEPTVEELKQAIVTLASDPNTTYLLLTSRTRDWCDSLFSSIQEPPPNLWFAAENGYFFKHTHHSRQQSSSAAASASTPPSSAAPSAGWHVMYENVDFGWMEGVHRVMTYFCERTPRSYIQVQETSMQWHYGDAEPTFAKRQALDLISHLTGGPLSNTATEVLDSANIVQVRPLAVSKGRALKHLLAYLHKRYHRKGGRRHWRRADTIASDSDEGEQGRGEVDDDSSAQHQLSIDAAPATGRSGLNAAAIQSALVESGVLITKEGETGGYEEDDEGAEEPHSRKQKGKAGAGSASHSSPSSTLSLASSPLHPPRSGLQIRSRRPSLADTGDAADASASESGSGHVGHSLVLPIPVSPAMQSSPTFSSSAHTAAYVPLDFILCVGNFLERDEDIFPLLNEWADLGTVPPLLSSGHTSVAPAAGGGSGGSSQHSTPSFHHRRLTLSGTGSSASPSAGGSSTQPLHGSLQAGAASTTATRKASTADLSSPLSASYVSDVASPSSEAGSGVSFSSSTSHFPQLNIYTVTVGHRPSRARFALPDLHAVNSLIVQLSGRTAHSQQPQSAPLHAQKPSDAAVDRAAAPLSHEAVAYPDKVVDATDADKANHNTSNTHTHTTTTTMSSPAGGAGKQREPTMHS